MPQTRLSHAGSGPEKRTPMSPLKLALKIPCPSTNPAAPDLAPAASRPPMPASIAQISSGKYSKPSTPVPENAGKPNLRKYRFVAVPRRLENNDVHTDGHIITVHLRNCLNAVTRKQHSAASLDVVTVPRGGHRIRFWGQWQRPVALFPATDPRATLALKGAGALRAE